MTANIASYDAGHVNALDTPKIEQTFLLKNTSAGSLTIGRVQPSCGCTTAVLAPAVGSANVDKSTGPVNLAPGEEAQVKVTVDLQAIPPGTLNKSVYVYLTGSQQPAAMLQITGELVPSVTLAPALLDFGKVADGQPHTLQITAKIDPRLTSGGKVPMLVSSDQALQIHEVPQITIITKGPAGQVPAKGRTWVRVGNKSVEVTPPPANAMLTRTYDVTIPARTPLGPLNAVLSFAPAAGSGWPATAKATPSPSATQSLLATATVLVVGQVTGDVAAQPQRLAFGTVPFRQATSRQILLTEVRAGALKDARIMTASPWLSAEMISADTQINPFTTPAAAGQEQASDSYRVLKVSLSSDAPPGNLTTQLKIMLANGQQLIIPVNGYINGNG